MKYHYICRDKKGNLFMTTEKCANKEEAMQYVGDNEVLYPFMQDAYEMIPLGNNNTSIKDSCVSFLKPLLLNGKSELIRVCNQYEVEIDDHDLFRPASRLMYLGAKVKGNHRYIYFELGNEDAPEEVLTWITHVDNFNETEKGTYIAVNSHHGTAYCINVAETKMKKIEEKIS